MGRALRERMSGVDHAWLRMEAPASPMTIVGLFGLEGRLAREDLKRVISTRFLAYPRFRSRPVEEASGSGSWELAHDFDLDAHVVAERLPRNATKHDLERLAGRLASTPLDATRPRWQFHLVERYGGGSAVIARIHHCYADGIALVRVVLSMTGASAAESRAAPRLPRSPAAASTQGWAGMLAPISGALAGGVQDTVAKGLGIAADAASLALMGRDAETRLKRPPGGVKRLAWGEPIPLEEVKAIAGALGCSVNDVLVSTAAGALRAYLAGSGDAVEDSEVRAVVPVNLRGEAEPRDLGNRFGVVFLALPVGIEHPLERLYEVRKRMAALKGSSQPLLAFALLGAVGFAPRALQDPVARFLGQNASIVITNVPGPQQPLYLGGARIRELGFWVPQSAGIGLGLSILSYDGRVSFGVMADAAVVPDPGRLAERFTEEFAKITWLALMSPWMPGAPHKPRAQRSRSDAIASISTR